MTDNPHYCINAIMPHYPEQDHPGFVHMPDWQVTAARHALAMAQSIILCGESMSLEAQAEITAALHYLVPYDTRRSEPGKP